MVFASWPHSDLSKNTSKRSSLFFQSLFAGVDSGLPYQGNESQGQNVCLCEGSTLRLAPFPVLIVPPGDMSKVSNLCLLFSFVYRSRGHSVP